MSTFLIKLPIDTMFGYSCAKQVLYRTLGETHRREEASNGAGSVQDVRENKQKGGNRVTVKRIIYLAMAALVAMLILVPTALAQDVHPGDDHPHQPEPHPQVASHEELQQIAGQPLPAQAPTQQHPDQVPAAPTQGLPTTGGLSVIVLSGALLLLGSGVLASSYAVLRRRRSR